MSATNNIGFMGAQEFLETFTYMYAYDQSKEFVSNYLPQDPNESPYIREAKESAYQLMVMMGIFKIIQYEEMILERLFNFVAGVLGAMMVLAKSGWNRMKTTVKRGRLFKWASQMLKEYGSSAIEKARLLLEWLRAHIDARKNSYQSGQIIQATQENRQAVVERDRSAMMLGKGMAENYVNSLMFKLFTSSFTAGDEAMIKRILGRETATELSVDDLNKIGSFMFTTDVNGNLTGLTEQFFQLLNGMGYLHKPSPVSVP